MARGLNDKQKAFAFEYLKDFNATQAAIRAGYSARTAGSQAHDLLKKPEIRSVVEGKLSQVEHRADRSVDQAIEEVCEKLEEILDADIGDCMGEDGALLHPREWPGPLRRACSGFEVEERLELTHDDEPVEVRVKKAKFWSKTESAALLLRKLRAFRHEDTDRAVDSLVHLLAAARKVDE